jgi:predicted GH43/DUF377 family glycosyl hydrolase
MAWDNGYNWKAPVVLTPSDDGALTDHRATLTIVKSTGSNAENIAYLQDDALNWPYDIRFTSDADGLVDLNFWRKESDATDGTWIILIPTVAASGNTTIYMWYGKADDTDASNGLSTCKKYENWDRNNTTPILQPGGGWDSGGQNRWGSIALVDGTFYIFYTSGSASTSDIGRATSTDLVNWTVYASNPIIENIIGPAVLKELDGKTPIVHDSKYWMATMKSDGTDIQIRSADTIDGAWTLVTDNAIVKGAAGTWRANSILTCCFTYESGTYYIFFEGADSTYWKIGYATASDPAGPYTVATDPVLAPGLVWEGTAIVDPEVRKFGDTYYLFYSGNTGTQCYNAYATSDSITGTWTKADIKISDIGQSYPAILEHNGLYYMICDDLESGATWKDLYTSTRLDTLFTRARMAYAGTPTASSSELLINAASERVWRVNYDTYGRLIARVKLPATLINYHYFGWNVSSVAGTTNCAMFVTYAASPYLRVFSADASTSEYTDVYNAAYKEAYCEYEIRWRSGQVTYYINGALVATHTTRVPSTAIPVHFVDYTGNGNLYVDWFAVLDSPTDYPTITPGTAEESGSTPTMSLGGFGGIGKGFCKGIGRRW